MQAALLAALISTSLLSCGRTQTPQGVRTTSLNANIVDGEVSTGKEPWAHSIVGIGQKKKDGTYEIYCTGSLIESNLVVTAAHCLHDQAKDIYVIFGLNDDAPIAIRETEKTALHEKYDRTAPDNQDTKNTYDIGLIRFKGLPPDDYVVIPVMNDHSVLKNGMKVTIAGYGQTDAKQDASSGVLHNTTITLTDVDFSETEVTGDESKSAACFGDSGGPLMIEVNGQFTVWGVISRGDDACKAYGVYTRLDVFKDWIASHR